MQRSEINSSFLREPIILFKARIENENYRIIDRLFENIRR